MPFAEITMIEGRSKEKKAEVIKQVTEALANALDAPRETIRVCIREVPAENWGIAGIPKSEMK